MAPNAPMAPLPSETHGIPRIRARVGGALVAFGLAAVVAAGPADEPTAPATSFGETLEITAVTVAVRATEGKKPAAMLRPEDLEVLEDGVVCPVIHVERVPSARGAKPAAAPPAVEATAAAAPAPPPARPWRVLIYVDLQLAGVTSVRQAGWELGARAEELAALGEVEVWVADDEAKRIFGPSRDVDGIRKALRKNVADNFGQRRVLRLRERFIQESNQAIGLVARRGTAGDSGSELNLIRAFAVEETRTVEIRRALLERVLAERSAPDWPQAALVVTGGFDLVPGDFYLPKAAPMASEAEMMQRLSADLERWAQGQATDRAARQLAALGWTVVTVLPYDQATNFGDSAQFDGSAAWNRMFAPGAGAGTASAFLVLRPEEPWEMVGEMTGGEVVTDVRELDDALARLADRWLVTYQVSRRKDGALRKLEVRPRREGLALHAPEWVSSGSAEAIAASRAKALLAGGAERGELPVVARVEASPADEHGQIPGRVEARVEFTPIAAAKGALVSTTLRFTVAVPRPDGTIFVVHERAEKADLSQRAGWIFEARLLAPKGTASIAVVVEELATGAWGGATANWGS